MVATCGNGVSEPAKPCTCLSVFAVVAGRFRTAGGTNVGRDENPRAEAGAPEVRARHDEALSGAALPGPPPGTIALMMDTYFHVVEGCLHRDSYLCRLLNHASQQGDGEGTAGLSGGSNPRAVRIRPHELHGRQERVALSNPGTS